MMQNLASLRGSTTSAQVQHPLRQIIRLLPGLPVNGQNIDFPAADAYKLKELSEHLGTITAIAQNGLACLGQLLALASPEIEGGEFSSESIEALGWLLSELGDLAAWATVLNASCKQANVDFSPTEGQS